MARGRDRAGTARTSGLLRPLAARCSPLDRSARRRPRPETIVRCRSPGSRGARGGGRGPRWAGRLRLGPGDPRHGCHLPRAPAAPPHPAAATGSGWGTQQGHKALPFVVGASWAVGARGMQVVRLAPWHPSSTFALPSPNPLPPLTPCGDETRRAGLWESGRDAPLAVSELLATSCAKFCLSSRERGAWRVRGWEVGGYRSPRTPEDIQPCGL